MNLNWAQLHDVILKLVTKFIWLKPYLFRFVRRTLKSSAVSHSNSRPTMKQWRSATNQWKRCAMVRDQRSAELSMSHPAVPSMLRNSQASLLETPLVRSSPLRSVVLDVPLRRDLKSVMTRLLLPLWMSQRRFVIWTHRKPVGSSPNLSPSSSQNINVPLCQRRPVPLSSLSHSRWTNHCWLSGVWTLPLQHQETAMMKRRPLLHQLVLLSLPPSQLLRNNQLTNQQFNQILDTSALAQETSEEVDNLTVSDRLLLQQTAGLEDSLVLLSKQTVTWYSCWSYYGNWQKYYHTYHLQNQESSVGLYCSSFHIS